MMDRLIDTVKIEVNPNDGFVVRVIRESAAIITVPWRTEWTFCFSMEENQFSTFESIIWVLKLFRAEF